MTRHNTSTSVVGGGADRDVVVGSAPEAVVGHTGVLPAEYTSLLVEARENQRCKRLAFARELELAAHVADLNGYLSRESTGLPGVERLVQVGGEGTPLVAEFAHLDYAAAMRMSAEAAQQQIGLALDLRHRLPGLWALVMTGELDAWKGRELVGLTSVLGFEACLAVDAELARCVLALPWARVKKYAQALVLQALPSDEAAARQQAAMDARHVTVDEADLGTAGVHGVLAAGDALNLDRMLDRVASILGRGGVSGSREVRRALALGVLATPARALQLLQADLLDVLPDALGEAVADDERCALRDRPGHECGAVTVDPEALLPRAELVVHLTDETLAAGAGVARVEQVGVVLVGQVRELLGHSRGTLRPVIDANHLAPVDSYECPAVMRRAVELRNPVEVFPWSKRRSALCDIDHTRPYRHPLRRPGHEERGRTLPSGNKGTTGQTHLGNLAPLGRRAHRAKTHGGWRMAQPVPGVVLWSSPTGFSYLVTPSGTHELHVPQRPVGPRPTDWGLTPGQRRQRARAAARERLAAAKAQREEHRAEQARAKAAQAPPLFG